MKTRTAFNLSVVAVITMLAAPVNAGTTVIGFILGGTGSILNNTVPTGKVLLVENISAYFATNTPTVSRVILDVGLLVQNGGVASMRFGYPMQDRYTAVSLPRPLRVPEGRVISISSDSNLGYDQCRVQGALVDSADLYAANLDLNLKAEGIEAGRFRATASLASPRPSRIETRTSTDLAAFVANATEEQQHLSPFTNWNLFTAADSRQKFLVAKATTREIR